MTGNTLVQHAPLHLAVIVGSTRAGRFGPTVANWFVSQAEQRDGMTIDLIDLVDAQLPFVLSSTPGPPVAGMSARLAAADAFVIVTPEYNHSFPAALKNAIDWHFVEWRAKPIGCVSSGGASGGLRAVEQLRQVFAELHAVTIRDGVSFADIWRSFDANGALAASGAAREAAARMLVQLRWWARTLRDARAASPYGL